jgi:hypothetical protein
MRLAKWFKRFLVLWAVTALPLLILIVGFSGDDFEFELDGTNLFENYMIIMPWVYIASPAFLLPFAVRIAR